MAWIFQVAIPLRAMPPGPGTSLTISWIQRPLLPESSPDTSRRPCWGTAWANSPTIETGKQAFTDTVSPARGGTKAKRWKHHVPRMAMGTIAASSGQPSCFIAVTPIMFHVVR